MSGRGRRDFRRAGHLPTLAAALLYFDVSFMVWVLLGPLGPFLGEAFRLSATQKGLLIATPLLSGSFFRPLLGALADRCGGRRTGLAALGFEGAPRVAGIGSATGGRKRPAGGAEASGMGAIMGGRPNAAVGADGGGAMTSGGNSTCTTNSTGRSSAGTLFSRVNNDGAARSLQTLGNGASSASATLIGANDASGRSRCTNSSVLRR